MAVHLPSVLHPAGRRGSKLQPGCPTAHEKSRLGLLPSGPDPVRRSSLHGTRPSTPLVATRLQDARISERHRPCYGGLQVVRVPPAPHLARPFQFWTHACVYDEGDFNRPWPGSQTRRGMEFATHVPAGTIAGGGEAKKGGATPIVPGVRQWTTVQINDAIVKLHGVVHLAAGRRGGERRAAPSVSPMAMPLSAVLRCVARPRAL